MYIRFINNFASLGASFDTNLPNFLLYLFVYDVYANRNFIHEVTNVMYNTCEQSNKEFCILYFKTITNIGYQMFVGTR